MRKNESQKRLYDSPSLQTYSGEELLAEIGPAVAIYGNPQP